MWMWWIALAVLFLAGLGVGFLWGRSSTDASRKAEKLDRELRETRAALNAYKDEVNAHFATTAELVQQLTENYKAVYRHLAEGSEKLCGPNAPRLPRPGPETLESQVDRPTSPADITPAPPTEQQPTKETKASGDRPEEQPTPPEKGDLTADATAEESTTESAEAPKAPQSGKTDEPDTPSIVSTSEKEAPPPRTALH